VNTHQQITRDQLIEGNSSETNHFSVGLYSGRQQLRPKMNLTSDTRIVSKTWP